MKFILPIILLMFAGCTISSVEIDISTELCKDNGGIDYIQYGTIVKCKNGAEFDGIYQYSKKTE